MPFLKKGLMIAGLITVADQLSKWWILEGLKLPELGSIPLLPFLNFTMVWNKGIAMGIPLGEALGKWGIVVLTCVISLWLVHLLRSSVRQLEAISYAILLGGAIGNLIDRFLHGAVVDFIHLHAGGYSFYVFNIADSALSIGVVLMLIDSLREMRKSPKKASKDLENHP